MLFSSACASALPDETVSTEINLVDTTNFPAFIKVQHEDEAAGEMAVSIPLHLEIALSYEGVTEVERNTGPEIDRFLSAVGLKPGLNYCAAFVSYVLDQADVAYPTVRSGIARHFITNQSIDARDVLRGTHTIPPGYIAVWGNGDTWRGHTGFNTCKWKGPVGCTIEANTSPGTLGNQRSGNGVYQRERSIQPGSYFRIVAFTPVRYG